MRAWVLGAVLAAACAAAAGPVRAETAPDQSETLTGAARLARDAAAWEAAGREYRAALEALSEGRAAESAERLRSLLERWPELSRPRAALARAAALAGECGEARAMLEPGAPGAAEAQAAIAGACERDPPPVTSLRLEMGLPGEDRRLPWEASALDLSLAEGDWGGARMAIAPSDAAWATVGFEVSDGRPLQEDIEAARQARLALHARSGEDPRLSLGARLSLSPKAPEPVWSASAELFTEAGSDSALARAAFGAGARLALWDECRLDFSGSARTQMEADGVLRARAETRLGLETPLAGGLRVRAEGGQAREATLDSGLTATDRAWARAAVRRDLGRDVTAEAFAKLDAEAPGTGRWQASDRRYGARVVWGGIADQPARVEVGLFRSAGAEPDGGAYLMLSRSW